MPKPALAQAPPLADAVEHLQWIGYTCAHFLAMAIKRLFTKVKVTVDSRPEVGFYYDFDCSTPFAFEDSEHIETEMGFYHPGEFAHHARDRRPRRHRGRNRAARRALQTQNSRWYYERRNHYPLLYRLPRMELMKYCKSGD